MKIYRLTVKGDRDSGFVVYDSSEARMTRDFDYAVKSRWTRFAEIAVISTTGPVKRSQMLDALNGRADQWNFVPIVGYERDDVRQAA